MSDIKSGTVIRGLKSASQKPFSSEEVDEHGRLTEASVNSIEGSKDPAAIIIGMAPSMHAFGTRTTTVQKIIQKGGRVMKVPVPGNPNHCQIFGLNLKDANNLFSS